MSRRKYLNKIICGDCLKVMKEIDDNSIDSVVCDPPYGLDFMGKEWDNFSDNEALQKWSKQWASEALRVLKPGGHLIAFGGTRTYHRMATGIEDAGFEVRDMLEWIYASGFPKSLNIGKAVDKKLGNERKVVEIRNWNDPMRKPYTNAHYGGKRVRDNIPMKDTKGNSEWEGFGTALKPAHEPIVLARKPLSEKTIVENVLKHGTSGLDIDGCRIPTIPRKTGTKPKNDIPTGSGNGLTGSSKNRQAEYDLQVSLGRFPANILVTDDALGKEESRYFDIDVWAEKHGLIQVPKASKSERNEGLEGLEEKEIKGRDAGQDIRNVPYKLRPKKISNHHPTVKPVHLMAWLVRLVTPPKGTCLDPFIGSGTTGIACIKEGFDFIGIEQNAEYFKIAEARIKHWQSKPKQKKLFKETK